METHTDFPPYNEGCAKGTRKENETFEKEQASGHFWNALESDLGVTIPSYVKNMLPLHYYDNPYSFNKITDTVITGNGKFCGK